VWTGTRAVDATPELEAAFAAHWRARVDPVRSEVAARGAALRSAALAAAPLAGIGLCEADDDPQLGYGSVRCARQLAQLEQLGPGGIALTCTFQRGAGPLEAPAHLRRLAPREGDLALFATALAARGQGLSVALQSSLLTSAAGTYAGSWSPADEAEWTALFADLTSAAEHAALLANLVGAEWLQVGAGLRGVSVSDPYGRPADPDEERWRRDGWRRVLGAARGAFPQLVTYAAVGLDEARRVGFWGDLDAIGYELFPHASAAPGPNPRLERESQVRHVLAELAAIAARVDRPVALTRVGFPALAGVPIGAARREPRGRDVDLLTTCLLEGPAPVRAAWLWRASTDPSDPGVNAGDYVLTDPADAAEVTSFFRSADRWFTAASRAAPRAPR
jgi:hypothetical protein